MSRCMHLHVRWLVVASAAVILGSWLVAPTGVTAADPTERALSTWPPKGEAVRLPVTRDTWFGTINQEDVGNNGGASQMKLKGQQEYSLFDVDVSSLKGKLVTGALWHVRCASLNEPLLRVSVSSVASPWVEGTASGYKAQEGSACFKQAELGKRDWTFPGSTFMETCFGRGHTVWRFADATQPDEKDWQTIAVEPDVVAARVAGLSEGFAVADDVGNVWSYKDDKFTWTYFPNRFIYSHEQSASAPWLEVWTDGEDHEAPDAIADVAVSTEGLPAGEALVTWATPADKGGGKTLGFNVTYKAGDQSKPVPRYLVPMAGKPGQQVRMHIVDLPFKPGESAELTVSAVDSAGNVGAPLTKTVKLSATPRVLNIAESDIKPFPPSQELPEVGGLRIAVVDLLDKIDPKTGEMIPQHPDGYLGGNHIWSAKQKLVRLQAARNEAVCFQVNLAGQSQGVGLELAFPDQPQLQTQVLRFDYTGTSAGPLPDALLPLGGSLAIPNPDDPEAAGQKNASVLCEIYVPHQVDAGTKSGTLTIASGGQSLSLAVELTVWDFTLPNKLSFVPEMNAYSTVTPAGRGLDYYRLAHEHRCCLNRLYYNWPGDVTMPPERKETGLDWAGWAKSFGPLLDGSAFKGLPRDGEPVDVFYLPFNENWPINIHKHYRKSYWPEDAFDPAYKVGLKKEFAEFAEFCDKQGWHDTILEFYLNNKVYYKQGEGWMGSAAPWIFDEPVNTQDFWALRWYGLLFHQAIQPVMGQAKLWYRGDISYSPYERDMFWGVMDLECLGGGSDHKARLEHDEHTLWRKAYFTEYGSANNPASPNTQPTSWCLVVWSRGGVGVLPWQTIATSGAWQKGEQTGLFYANSKGVFPSVRLKAFRRGQQDVEYLTLLGMTYNASRPAVAAGMQQIVDLRGRVHKTSETDAGTLRFGRADPVGLWNLRCRVGKMVSAKKPAYQRCVRPMPSPKVDLERLPDLGYVTVAPKVAPVTPE